jgi:hypothetical protein
MADGAERQATQGVFPCGVPNSLRCVSGEQLTLNQRVQGSSPCAPTKFNESNQQLNLIVPFDVRFDFRRGNACGNE